MLLTYLWVFLVGGFICFLGQILIIKTKITSSRILVIFLSIGAFLEICRLYEPIREFASAGAIVPITGFGASISKGAIDAVREVGLLGIFTGGLAAVSAGITCAVVFGFLFGLLFNSKTKNY